MRAINRDTSTIDFAIRQKELEIIKLQAMAREAGPIGLPHDPIKPLLEVIKDLNFKREMVLKYGNDIVNSEDNVNFSFF